MWRYVLLIVLLFAIVVVASHFIVEHLAESFPQPENEPVIGGLRIAILALTFGCLFLAGAMGVWAIRSTSESEGRLRIGRFVDTMDYFSDGLLVIDGSGRVTGSNPAARRLAARAGPDSGPLSLCEMFPQLTEADLAALLDRSRLREIERDNATGSGLQVLRFRSQPAEGVMRVLVSDVTDLRSREIRQRQVTQLQLVGRIAGGMAHDFNNILCSIAGHAALLARRPRQPEEEKQQAIAIILEQTERGSQLSRQLLGISRSGIPGEAYGPLARDVEDAAALLRIALPAAWQVKTLVGGDCPATPLTSAQIEQVILNLGLLAADAQAQPGAITLTLRRPGPDHLVDVGERYAAVILVSVEGRDGGDAAVEPAPAGDDEAGVIVSVVKSLVEEAQGRLDLFAASSGARLFRVCLPHLDVPDGMGDDDSPSNSAFDCYVAGWNVMLGGSGPELDRLKRHLERCGTRVAEKDTVMALLADFKQSRTLDAIVMERRILGAEADPLLLALRKLCPQVGIVVLGHDALADASGNGNESAFVGVPHDCAPERVVGAMVEARGQARAAARGA